MDRIGITMTEAAKLMNVSRPTIYRWSKIDGFPCVRIGGCTRVLVDDLQAWVRNQMQEESVTEKCVH